MDALKSFHNPLIKYILKLKKRRFREQEGKFAIEGVRMVEEAINSTWTLENIIYTGGLLRSARGEELITTALKKSVKTILVDEKLLGSMASTETPQGVMALCKARKWFLEDLCGSQQAIRLKSGALLVVVDGVSDPGNLGTIIRSSDAFGASGVILIKGTVDLYNSKALRATMGSIFHLPVVEDIKPDDLMALISYGGFSLLVGAPEGGFSIHRKKDYKDITVLVVGSEASGPSREILSLPHEKITVPMCGGADSLNAGVAASIMIYEIMKQGSIN